jgi:tetratricopeptide (TPR) repeat protein
MGIRTDLLVTEEIAESSDLRATPFEFEKAKRVDGALNSRRRGEGAEEVPSTLAVENYQKNVELAPDQAQPRYNLAIAYVRKQKVDDAIFALKEAERLRADYAWPYFLLGNIYYQQHRFYLTFDQLLRNRRSLLEVKMSHSVRIPNCIRKAGKIDHTSFRT